MPNYQGCGCKAWSFGEAVAFIATGQIASQLDRRSEKKFLRVAFKHFDVHKKRTLSKDDLRSIVTRLEVYGGAAYTDVLFKMMTEGRNDCVRMADWVQNMPAIMKEAIRLHPLAAKWASWSLKTCEEREEVRFLQYAFDFFRFQNRGTLSKENLREVLLSLKLPADGSDVNVLFGMLDENEDNEIQMEEWVYGLPPSVKQALFKHTVAAEWDAMARSSAEEVMLRA